MPFLEDALANNLETLSALKESFQNGDPIHHIYESSFFSEKDVMTILSHWPSLQDERWHTLQRMIQFGVGKKLEISSLEKMPQPISALLKQLQTKEFIQAVEYITGIPNLKSDMDLYGGGIVYTPSGGFLKIHADFNYYDKIKLYRRVNLIIYMNEEWNPDWKGGLQLWSSDMKEKKQEYLPFLNHFILFRVNDKAFHGYPEPLACPETVGRKSINLYYYSEEPDTHQDKEPHKTIWMSDVSGNKVMNY